MSVHQCFICGGVVPCYAHGDPGPIGAANVHHGPNVRAWLWFSAVVVLAVLGVVWLAVR